MHVLLVHQFFATPASNGGTRHYEFFTRLNSKGFRFTVIASSEQLNNVSSKKTDRINPCEIVSVSSLPLGNKGYVWRVFGFLSFMFTAVLKGLSVHNVDIVIGTTPSLFQAFSAFIIASIRRKPFLLEVRDLWPAFAVDIGLLKSPILIRMAEWLEVFLYRKADHIVVNSPAYIRYLINKDVPESKITLVPNGVDVEAFSSVTEKALVDYRDEWGVADDKYLIVYAGAIRMANCLDMLVETAVELEKKNSHVFIAVIGDGRDRCRLEGKVFEFGLKNIKFCGPLPKSAMPDAIATSDACFAGLKDIPMFTMTYPNKVFDYMAGARPTILAIDGVIREVVEAAGGGVFVSPSDSAAIADAMHEFSNNPEKSSEMGYRAFRYVKEKFNRDNHAAVFGQVLNQLKAEPSSKKKYRLKNFWKTIDAVVSRVGITDKSLDKMVPFMPRGNDTACKERQHSVTMPISPRPEKKMGHWPYFDDEQIQAAVRVLQSGRVNYWTGSEVKHFETEFASRIGVDHAVAVANGTVALELALLALGICEGDEVIVPSRTFIATASAVARIGAIPVVADIDSRSQAITASTIEKVFSKRTKGIIVVHLGGWPADMSSIMAFAEHNGLAVIEDCSQAHGATYDGQHVGSFGNISTFSFCQDKIMTTAGEGGMVVTNDSMLWEKAWSLKDHGKNINKTLRSDGDGTFRFVHDSIGTNWRMTEIQAAIGRCQLKQLTSWVNLRRKNAEAIRDSLQDIEALSFPVPECNLSVSYYRLYGFLDCSKLAPGWSRDEVVRQLQSVGANVGVGSCGIIQCEQGFSKFGKVSETPIGERLHHQSLAFAVHPTLSDDDLIQTVRIVRKVLMKATGQQRSGDIAA